MFFAGIDGGQSGTVAVIGDENGRPLGRGNAGPADEIGQGPQSTRLRDALQAALGDAVAHAGLPADTRFTRIVAGISGYDGKVYGVAPQLPADNLVLMHDAPIALAGALGGSPGVIVIAGTGSAAYARNAGGESAMTGGWGYLFGDEGSGFWLAREAVRAAMSDADAGDTTDLTSLALQHFSARSLRDLARGFYSGDITRAAFAAFATDIVQAAERGNEKAALLVCKCGRALVTLAEHAMERTGMQQAQVAFLGGLTRSATMRDQIAQSMRELLTQATLVQAQDDAAAGALLLARKG